MNNKVGRDYLITEQKLQDTRDAHIYFNITLQNPTGTPIQAQYAEVRSDPITLNPEDYHMSIERFNIPTVMVPLDINKVFTTGPLSGVPTIPISVTIAYTGLYSQVFWGTGSNTFPDYTGSSPFPLGIPNDPQLSYNYYQSVCDIFNTTIKTAESNLASNAPTYTGDFTPFFSYDANVNLFRINAPKQYCLDNGSNVPKLWINNSGYLKVNSIPAMANSISLQQNPTGCDYQLKIRNNGGLQNGTINGWGVLNIPYTTQASYITGLSLPQEYNNLSNINTMISLQFLTNDIPVTPQGHNNQNPGTVSDQSRLIFTNFQVPSSIGWDVRNTVSFFLQGERRLIDLQGNNPLRKLSWNLYWSDTAQHLFPVYIPPYSAIDILVQFIKKGIYT